jgi:hypothetical protein
MDFSRDYPIYLVPHGGGYASIVDPQAESVQLLVVYTEEQDAADFMIQFGLPGSPRALHNDREFLWLLQSLQSPVTQVAFDPRPVEQQVNSRWTVSVQSLMEDHLAADYSPWSYPIFVIATDCGFTSIQGQASDGRPILAVAVFTKASKARAYLEAAEETGTLCKLADMDQARRFLESLALEVFAVAVDPVVTDEKRSAKHCFDIATLLEKYLVRES